jgi:hypothetical protein
MSLFPTPASLLWGTSFGQLLPPTSSQLKKNKKIKKLFLPERKVGEIILAICTHWSVFLSICSGVAQCIPFVKEIH